MPAVLQIAVLKRKDEMGLTLPSNEGVKRLGLKMVEYKSRHKKFDAFSVDIPILDISDAQYLEKVLTEFYEDLKKDPGYKSNVTTTLVEPSTVEEVIRLGVLNNESTIPTTCNKETEV